MSEYRVCWVDATGTPRTANPWTNPDLAHEMAASFATKHPGTIVWIEDRP